MENLDLNYIMHRAHVYVCILVCIVFAMLYVWLRLPKASNTTVEHEKENEESVQFFWYLNRTW